MADTKQPVPLRPGDRIPAAWLNKVAEAIVQRMTVVPGRVSRSGTSIAIHFSVPRLGGRGGRPTYIRIRTVTVIPGAHNRWRYTGVRSVLKPDGKFADAPGASDVTIYNTIEANNRESGVQGHGVNISGADYPPGFSVRAIAIGAVVPAWKFREDGPDGEEVWLTTIVNADDGTCT